MATAANAGFLIFREIRMPFSALPARRESVSWRSIGARVISTGVPTAVGMVHPFIGIAIAAVELAMALTVFGTALFGSRERSERAFRLMRWIANRPEPPTPIRDPEDRQRS